MLFRSDKVNQLLDLGDLSYLSEEIGEKQDFNQPTSRTWCLAYGRDRGEDGVSAKITPSRSYFIKVLGDNVDYVYLFRDHCDAELRGWWCYRDGRSVALPNAEKINSAREMAHA